MKNNNIDENLNDSDFFFVLAHLTSLNEEELMISSINFENVIEFDE